MGERAQRAEQRPSAALLPTQPSEWGTPRRESEAPLLRHPCRKGEAQFAVLRTAETLLPIFRLADQVSASQSVGHVLGSLWSVRAIRFGSKPREKPQIGRASCRERV